MWRVEAPRVTTAATAEACVKRIRDSRLRAAVRASIPQLEANADIYRENVAAAALHSVLAHDFPLSQLGDNDMKWLYNQRLVRSTSPGRQIYDQLMVAAPNGLCAYCQHDEATELDHFVPKDHVASLSIEPWNLVPSCHRCNHLMGKLWSGEQDKQMLHPYNVPPLGRWLYAKVDRTTPPAVLFSADPDSSLDQQLANRICEQFKTLQLHVLFSKAISSELSGLNARLPRQYDDQAELQKFLTESAAVAFADDANSRRGALYEGLSNDSWYIEQVCSGAAW